MSKRCYWWYRGMLQWHKGYFTHETEGPWPLHFKHSHWWERRSRCKLTSRCAWGTNTVSERKMDVKSIWLPTWHRMDHVSWSLGLFSKRFLGDRPNTKPGDHGTPKVHKCWMSIWLKARSYMTPLYTWGPVTTLHDFGSVLRRPLATSFGLS